MARSIILNREGKVSLPRVCCLMAVALGMLGYATVLLCEDPVKGDASVAAVSAQITAPDGAVAEAAEPEAKSDPALERRLELRGKALLELASNIEYMRNCGTANRGFVGCELNFSEEIQKAYGISRETDENGFNISLEAQNEQAQDDFVRFSFVSPDALFAQKADGSVVPGHELGLKPESARVIERITDADPNYPAPSGREPFHSDTVAAARHADSNQAQM